MPFKPQNNLDPNPDVRIFFIGLNIIKNEGNDVHVFVHNGSPVHQLTVETRRKRPGKPDQLMMRIVGRLQLTDHDSDPANPHTHGLMIQTFGLQPGTKGVTGYNGVEMSSEGTKFTDSFVLETLLGGSPGKIERAGGTPTILIDHGVFYTADKVTAKAQIVRPGTTPIPLTEVPTVIGANIYLDPAQPNEIVRMFWRQEGKDVFLPLDRFPNSSYEVYVINEPLFEEISPTTPRHGEFEEYFKILKDVGKPNQFEVEFLEDIPQRGTTRAPCMSVFYGG